MTTQHLEEAEELADHLALLETGKLVSSGTVDEIKKKYGVGYNLRITGSSDMALKEVTEIINSLIPESYVSSRTPMMGPWNPNSCESVNFVLPL
jgi:ABC-type multidrug transport system ATPase subunit